MKKLISVVLLISLSLSLGIKNNVTLAKNTSNNGVNAIELFEAIGIIDNADAYLQKMDQDMSRAEFINLVGGFLENQGWSGKTQIFNDVPPTNNAFTRINIMAECGIVSGVGDGNFEPNTTISYDEALAILLKMTGYGDLIGVNGGYPAGCYRLVANFKLFKDAKLNAEPTVGNLCDLIYCAVQEDLMKPFAGNYYKQKSTAEKENLLSKCFDVYLLEGVLTSDGIVDIKNTTTPLRNQIMVDGKTFLSNKDYSEYLGQSVVCFYKSNDKVQDVAVYIAPGDDNKILDIDAKKVFDFKNMTVYYTKPNGSSTYVRIDNQMDYVYNNTVAVELTKDMIVPSTGRLRFIDNDDDGDYDVAIIKSYQSFVIRTISQMDDMLVITARENLDLPIVYIAYDETNDTVVLDSDYNRVDYTYIKTGLTCSVATVWEDDKLIAKEIILSDATVYGDTVSYEADEDGARIVIDDTSYEVAYSLINYVEKMGFRTGASYNVNVFNEIVDVVEKDMSDLDLAMGYILNANYDPIEERFIIRIFTELGKVVVYDVNDHIIVDDVAFKKKAEAYEKLRDGGKIEPQLVAYKLAENREINYIDTAETYTGEIGTNYYNRLSLSVPSFSSYYQKEQHSFGGKAVMDEATRVFILPTDVANADERDLRVAAFNDVVSGTTYTSIEAYSLNNQRAPADAIIIRTNNSTMPVTADAMAVKGVYSAVNENGDITYSINLLGINGEVTYYTADRDVVEQASAQDSSDSSKYRIKQGDIVRIETNRAGEVSKIVLVYEYSTGKIKNGIKFAGTFFNSARAIKVGLYRILGDYMLVTDTNMETLPVGTPLDSTKLETLKLSKFAIVKYETDNGHIRIRPGTTEDLIPYTTSSDAYSKLVVYTHNATEKILFVLE